MAKEEESVKLTRRIRKAVWKANEDYGLVEEGDKIMVCLSGGKDSYTMLDILLHIQKSPLLHFDIIAVNLDQKQPDFPEHILPQYLEKIGVEYKIVERDTYSIVVDKIKKGKTMCSLCSRLRRGILYSVAEELGCNKVALGHHREDIMETLFLNMFYSGRIETMPPKYKTDDGKHIVIRPLAFCKEADIEAYSHLKKFPIIPCNLCGSQDGLQRQAVKDMLKQWDEKSPGRKEIIFKSIKNIAPSHMLDKGLFDFENYEIKTEKSKAKVEDMVP
jgi:tRNA 2-thiocytidine biosynthesis protein TtcA